ncbi:MAG: hypothetical protein CL859_00010 [Cyanobium sp. ARS6]|nr:hypothetical protein [Cyanobium sp. ARS6]
MGDQGGTTPPGDPTPLPGESALEAQLRVTARIVADLATALGTVRLPGGQPPPQPTVDSLVRACTETSVVKSLNDDNYTALERGWRGNPIDFPANHSKHHDRGLEALDALPEGNESEIREKSKMIITFHRLRGLKLIDAEKQLPLDAYVPSQARKEHSSPYRLPQPPRKGVSYSEMQRQETSAERALQGRCWDPRWSWSYNTEQLMLILTTSFKHVIQKYRSYGSYIRGTNSHFYLVEHFRIQCWGEAVLQDDSPYVIPYRDVSTHSSATRQSGTTMKHVDRATFEKYYKCADESRHHEFNPSHGLSESIVQLLVERYGEDVATMVENERSDILPQFKDCGYERVEYSSRLVDNEVLDGIEYRKINPAFERSNVLSEIEWNILSNVMGDIALSYTEQRSAHRTELRVYQELHDLERDCSDNYFADILHILKQRLPESHGKKVTVLETLFDDMLGKYDATAHRLSHLIQGLLSVNSRILKYGDSSNQRPESDLHKSLILKLKVWYRSVPKDAETPLSDEWARFVSQLKYLNTKSEHKIDENFKAAMTELHALLQLSVDLEADHQDTVYLPETPPIYFTTDYAGIHDQPTQADSESVMFTSSSMSPDDASESGHQEHKKESPEELFKVVTGASGRTYNVGPKAVLPHRPPPRKEGDEPNEVELSHRKSRGRPPDRRDSRSGRWNQQLPYYSQGDKSRGGG